jgi:hypothetical protein
MIPRYQRVLFWCLVGAIVVMLVFLLHGREQAQKRLTALNDYSPIAAPATTTTQDVTLYLANDADASISPSTRQLALPEEPAARARILLEQLLSIYALLDSSHPLHPGPAVDDVFLLPNPEPDPEPGLGRQPGQLAVVSLRGSFIGNHPSGIQVENLTMQSIIGTLHAALPQITAIRFLVDGQPHDTLAGHADLLRTYPARDTTAKPMPPIEPQP